jgi:RimJ/RimL family protein N-acetyltransferase
VFLSDQITIEDAQHIASWISSPESLMQWAGPRFTYPFSGDQLQTHLTEVQNSNGVWHAFKASRAEDSEILGFCEIGWINLLEWRGHLCRIIVDPACRGEGIGSEMLRQVVGHAFDRLDLNTLTLSVFDFNLPAIKCYEKIGFKQTALTPNAREVNGQFWNLITMELPRDHWMDNK